MTAAVEAEEGAEEAEQGGRALQEWTWNWWDEVLNGINVSNERVTK